MINHTYKYLYNQDSVKKQITISHDNGTITNTELHAESMTLKERLCSESQLKFGCCEASELSFKMANVGNTLKDKWLVLTEKLNDSSTVFRFGKYKVYSDTPSAERNYRNIVAYDLMYDIINANVAEWYNGLTFPMTQKEFRDSFFNYVGVTQQSATLIHDSMSVEKTIESETISGKDIITSLCELNGVFGHINRDNNFEYISLDGNKEIINIDKSLVKSGEYEDFVTSKISKLQIKQEENDIGVTYGSGDNCYVIENNFLVYGKSSEDLQSICSKLYEKIKNITYRPYKGNIKGNPCYVVGDKVNISTRNANIESYILERTLTGIQSLTDTLEANGELDYKENVNSLERDIIQLKGKTNVLERTVDRTRSELKDVENGLRSEIEQTAENVKIEVEASLQVGSVNLLRNSQTLNFEDYYFTEITIDAPEYMKEEIQRLVNQVSTHSVTNGVRFVAISDIHNPGSQEFDDSTTTEKYRETTLHAGQAISLLSDMIKFDAILNFGDVAWGSSTTTLSGGKESIENANDCFRDAYSKSKLIATPGNHDYLAHSYTLNGGVLDADYVEEKIGTYQKVTFDNKKLCFIMLNTAELRGKTVTSNGGIERISPTQLQWFVNALKEIGSLSDASEWKVLIGSHHPPDWSNLIIISNVIKHYKDGVSGSFTHEGSTITYDFRNKNKSKIISYLHGHTHCNLVDNVYYKDSSNQVVQSDLTRIAIPNVCFARNNEYGNNSGTEYNGIEFGENITYNKTYGTAQETAFVVITVDLDNEIIYSDYYGVGLNRIVSINKNNVVVTNNIQNATTNNNSTIAKIGGSYTSKITPNDGYKIQSVKIEMDGSGDITSSAYDGNGNINIPNVTGNIVITVVAVLSISYNVNNLVITSEEQNSTDVYNGIGYKNGVYASESGDGVDASCVATGWIPYTWSPNNVLYVRGAKIDTSNDHVRFYGYENKNYINNNAYITGNRIETYFDLEVIEDGTYYKLTPLNNNSAINYIRISLIGTGENLFITVNEPIE